MSAAHSSEPDMNPVIDGVVGRSLPGTLNVVSLGMIATGVAAFGTGLFAMGDGGDKTAVRVAKRQYPHRIGGVGIDGRRVPGLVHERRHDVAIERRHQPTHVFVGGRPPVHLPPPIFPLQEEHAFAGAGPVGPQHQRPPVRRPGLEQRRSTVPEVAGGARADGDRPAFAARIWESTSLLPTIGLKNPLNR